MVVVSAKKPGSNFGWRLQEAEVESTAGTSKLQGCETLDALVSRDKAAAGVEQSGNWVCHSMSIYLPYNAVFFVTSLTWSISAFLGCVSSFMRWFERVHCFERSATAISKHLKFQVLLAFMSYYLSRFFWHLTANRSHFAEICWISRFARVSQGLHSIRTFEIDDVEAHKALQTLGSLFRHLLWSASDACEFLSQCIVVTHFFWRSEELVGGDVV